MLNTISDIIYSNISNDKYLKEIYSNLLQNYAIKLLETNDDFKKINLDDALRFADLLSKSDNKRLKDEHKLIAQEIITLLNFIYPNNSNILEFAGSVFSNTGNYMGVNRIYPNYKFIDCLEDIANQTNQKLMEIPFMENEHFFEPQKITYEKINDKYFSYSGPTSLGKSFLFKIFIKASLADGVKKNFAAIIPSKALINEFKSDIIRECGEFLSTNNYRVVTSSNDISMKQDHNYIFVLTPERLHYLLNDYQTKIDYLFIDEAHKICSNSGRSSFYYEIVSKVLELNPDAHTIFASPNIPNPEVFLKLLPDLKCKPDYSFKSSYSPVTQMKFYIDYQYETAEIYDSMNNDFLGIDYILPTSFIDMLHSKINTGKSLVYYNSKQKAMKDALEYSSTLVDLNDPELDALAKDIEENIHSDYYLPALIRKGIAFHMGSLPSSIRDRLEHLFKSNKNFNIIFCTSTLLEGVNFPADNLFITTIKNGYGKLSEVDFKNLIGRVGRIKYNLFGNVFLVKLKDSSENMFKFYQNPVLPQELSVNIHLTPTQKKLIISTLLKGSIEVKIDDAESQDNYYLLRKTAIILLKSIMNNKINFITQEFEPFLKDDIKQKIKEIFIPKASSIDDDINVSFDQIENLKSAISSGMEFPSIIDGKINYNELVEFLNRLNNIFKWEIYEPKTLGLRNKNTLKLEQLNFYAVILSEWITGKGIKQIINNSLVYKAKTPYSTIKINGSLETYNPQSKMHRNIVISDTLSIVDSIITFSIANYFLKISNEYKAFHNVKSFKNNWYEFVEFGTINTDSIFLQQNGYSRESALYLHRHQEYLSRVNGELKVYKSVLSCHSASVREESSEIIINIPELFI